MNKDELKDLVKRYFNLTEKENTTDTIEKQEFATAKLIDGTEITNMKDSEFAEGDEVHVITAEGEHVIAPSGEHELESGIVITIDEAGVITGIKRPDEEGEGSLEAGNEEMAEEPVSEEMAAEEVTETETSEEKTEMAEHGDEEDMGEHDIREEVIAAIAEVVGPEIESMKQKMTEIEEAMKDYMSKPATEPSSEKRFNKVSKETTKSDVLNKKRYEMALKLIANKK